MTQILGFLSFIFGPLMRIMYNFVGNYGLTMILFTVLIRIVTLPLAIKQQKSMAKMSVYTPMLNEIQQKYKNNQQKLNEEMMKFQQEYGYNPTAGCLPMFVNFFVMFGVIEAVYYPLQHILHISKDVLVQIADILGQAYNYTTNTAIIQMVHNNTLPAEASALLTSEQLASIKDFNVMFMGMDLTVKPELAFNILLLFPILSVVTMALSNIIMMKSSGQEMQGSMKWMPWMMSLMFVWIAFTVPVAFSLYYTVTNVLMLITSMITRKMYDPEKMKAQVAAEIEEKKKAKKAKKQVKVVDEKTGEEKLKEVTEAEMNRLRIERARAIDAELYKDERTTPLNAKTGEEESCEK